MKKLPKHIQEDGCKAQIDYPCQWQYKIIGTDKTQLLEAVNACVQGQDHTLTESNVSSGGRYLSMSLEMEVTSEEQRLSLHRQLAEHPAVKVVL